MAKKIVGSDDEFTRIESSLDHDSLDVAYGFPQDTLISYVLNKLSAAEKSYLEKMLVKNEMLALLIETARYIVNENGVTDVSEFRRMMRPSI